MIMRDEKGRFIKGSFDPNAKPTYGNLGKRYPYKPRPKAVGRSIWNKGLFKSNKYNAIHYWIRTVYGKADHCEFDSSHKGIFDWANISYSYLRDRNDWVPLCRKCHYQYDWVRSGRTYI